MGAGSRAIRSNWDELEQRGFVSIVRADVSGDPPIVRALKEDGSGDRYTIPTGRTGDTYRRVPEAAWRSLLHETGLSGPGLCMYLVSLRTFGQTRGGALTFPRSYFRREYGMGNPRERPTYATWWILEYCKKRASVLKRAPGAPAPGPDTVHTAANLRASSTCHPQRRHKG